MFIMTVFLFKRIQNRLVNIISLTTLKGVGLGVNSLKTNGNLILLYSFHRLNVITHDT